MSLPRDKVTEDTYTPSTCPTHNTGLRITRDTDDGVLTGICAQGCKIRPIFDKYDARSFYVWKERVIEEMICAGKRRDLNEQSLRELFAKSYTAQEAMEELCQ